MNLGLRVHGVTSSKLILDTTKQLQHGTTSMPRETIIMGRGYQRKWYLWQQVYHVRECWCQENWNDSGNTWEGDLQPYTIVCYGEQYHEYSLQEPSKERMQLFEIWLEV